MDIAINKTYFLLQKNIFYIRSFSRNYQLKLLYEKSIDKVQNGCVP